MSKDGLFAFVLGLAFVAVPCAAQEAVITVSNDTTANSVLDVTINGRFIGHVLYPGDSYSYRAHASWSFWWQVWLYSPVSYFIEACPLNEAMPEWAFSLPQWATDVAYSGNDALSLAWLGGDPPPSMHAIDARVKSIEQHLKKMDYPGWHRKAEALEAWRNGVHKYGLSQEPRCPLGAYQPLKGAVAPTQNMNTVIGIYDGEPNLYSSITVYPQY